MLIPFDPETGTVKAAIKVLIGLCRPPDSLRQGDSGIDLRARQKAHNAKQKELAEELQAVTEVPSLLALTRNGVNFVISGRADLLQEDHTVLEVKTAQPLPEEPSAMHMLQLLFYCQALKAENGILVYTDPDTGDSSEHRLNMEEGRELWEGFLDDVSIFVKDEWERHLKLERNLKEFRFPFGEIRAGQQEIIQRIREIGAGNGELLIQAPTGTGKTVAVLVGAIPPAVRDWNILFFLTAKNTQKKILAETMERIIDDGFSFRTIIIASRENSCPMDYDSCSLEECPYAEDFGERIRRSGIVNELTERVLITPYLLVEKAVEAEVCPFELSLFVSQRCDLVACDYNYVFDPGIQLKRFFADDSTASRCSLLVDEAANLPERVRGIWSPELRTSWMESTWRYARGNRRMKNLLRPWRKLLQAYAEQPWPHREREIRLSDQVELPRIDRRRWQKIMAPAGDAPREAILLSRAITGFSRVAERRDERFHLLAEKDGEDTMIRWYCTDPSIFITEQHVRCSSISCFSATLEPMKHFADELGLTGDHVQDSVGWPFPRENLRVWVDTGINTRYRQRDRQTGGILDRLEGARRKSPGTWMVFFPSFAWMEKIVLAAGDRDIPLIAQKREMTTVEREEFRDLINEGDHLVLAVAGGLFAEGVDLSIPDLRGCFIAGPSLPSISLKQELLKARYEETGRNGFLHAFAIPGINRVIQAAGRLIRNGEQTADLILLGERFIRDPYFNHLPEHWFPLRVIRNGKVSLKHPDQH